MSKIDYQYYTSNRRMLCDEKSDTRLIYLKYCKTMGAALSLEASDLPLMDLSVALESAGDDVCVLVWSSDGLRRFQIFHVI